MAAPIKASDIQKKKLSEHQKRVVEYKKRRIEEARKKRAEINSQSTSITTLTKGRSLVTGIRRGCSSCGRRRR